jgi:hypothetical protein
VEETKTPFGECSFTIDVMYWSDMLVHLESQRVEETKTPFDVLHEHHPIRLNESDPLGLRQLRMSLWETLRGGEAHSKAYCNFFHMKVTRHVLSIKPLRRRTAVP